MALYIERSMPDYDANNLPETVRSLFSAYRAMSEQLTYVFQNIDEDNGAASRTSLSALDKQLSTQMVSVSGAVKKAADAASGAQQKADDTASSMTTIGQTQQAQAALINQLSDKIKALPVIQYGTQECSFAPDGGNTHVTFPIAFAATPVITITPTFSTKGVAQAVARATAEGFDIYLVHPEASGTREIGWIAIGEEKTS